MTTPLKATMVATVVVLFVMMGTSFLSPVPAQATPVPSISMGANPVIPNLNESMPPPLTEPGNLSYIKPIQATAAAATATKNSSSEYLVHNATNIVPCGDKYNPDVLCLNHTQVKVKPGAIRCKDNPNVICYPPHNYTSNYRPTIVPPLTPICTYDPSGVIVCTTPQIQNQSNNQSNQSTTRMR